MKVLLYVLCVEEISVLHMEEKTIQRQKKLTDFDASSATENFDLKVVKVELLFSGFLAEHNLL